MLWSWYLADDTQFYVLGVMLLILATRYCGSLATRANADRARK